MDCLLKVGHHQTIHTFDPKFISFICIAVHQVFEVCSKPYKLESHEPGSSLFDAKMNLDINFLRKLTTQGLAPDKSTTKERSKLSDWFGDFDDDEDRRPKAKKYLKPSKEGLIY
jgi:hypothetical protein